MIRSNRRGWLTAALVALPLLTGSVSAFAQEVSPDQLALARKYVDLTDKVDLYGNTVAAIAAQTLNQLLRLNPQLGAQATQAVTSVVAEYKNKRPELVDQIARIYALHFTADELQQYVTFYSSPAGQKLAGSNLDVNTELSKLMQLFQGNLSTEFYAKVRATLKAKGVTL